MLAVAVRHPDYDQALWLVVSRPAQAKDSRPGTGVTTESIATEEDAWKVVFAYPRRWQIEMTFRFEKSELACESPRLWQWEPRLKLLLMVSLVYAFLLTLLDEEAKALRLWLLRCWCHRTGKRCREATAPLYRLRWAISRLWLTYAPSLLASQRLNSG